MHILHILYFRAVTCVCLAKNDRVLLSGSVDGTVRMWSFPLGVAMRPVIAFKDDSSVRYSTISTLTKTAPH